MNFHEGGRAGKGRIKGVPPSVPRKRLSFGTRLVSNLVSTNWPNEIGVDSTGNVYVVSLSTRSLTLKLNSTGETTGSIGSSSQGCNDGFSYDCKFGEISDIVVD